MIRTLTRNLLSQWLVLLLLITSFACAPITNSTKTPSFPFTLEVSKVELAYFSITAYLTALPSNDTKFGETYVVSRVNTAGEVLQDAFWFVKFSNPSQNVSVPIQLPDDVSYKLFMSTPDGRVLSNLLGQRDAAQKRLDNANAASEKATYDYFYGKGAPSYESAKRLEQELKDAKSALNLAQNNINAWDKSQQSTRVINGISIRDIVPYLHIEVYK